LEIARSISDDSNRSRALSIIGSELAKAGEPYERIFEEALEVARSISDDYSLFALKDIVTELAKIGEFEKALEIARSMDETEYLRSADLIIIGSELAKVGEPYEHIFEEALETARSISGEDSSLDLSLVLSGIAIELAKVGEFERALEFAWNVDNDNEVAFSDALSEIAIELAKAGKLEKALETARSITHTLYSRLRTLESIAIELVKARELEEALKVARSITSEQENPSVLHIRSRVLSIIGAELAKMEKPYKHLFEESFETARSISDGFEQSLKARSDALRDITPELAKAGEFEEALKTARKISDEYIQSLALSDIASELAKATLKKKAIERTNMV